MKYFVITFPDQTLYVGLSLSNGSVSRNVTTLENNAKTEKSKAYNSPISQKVREFGAINKDWVFVSQNMPTDKAKKLANKLIEDSKLAVKSLNKFDKVSTPTPMNSKTKGKIGDANRGEKSYLFGKTGQAHPKSIEIVQFLTDDAGKIVYEKAWTSRTEAEKALMINNISTVLHGRQKKAGGFYWMMLDKYLEMKEAKKKAEASNGKK